MSARTWRLLTDGVDASTVGTASAPDRWAVEPARSISLRRTFVDTYDRRVLGDGGVLEVDAAGDRRRLVWRDRDSSRVRADLDLPPEPAPLPRFAWELPAGPGSGRLGAVLDLRAMLPLATVRTRRRVLGVRNSEAKLVARIIVDDDLLIIANGVGRRRSLGTTVEVVPLRGYEREADRIARRLLDATDHTPSDSDDLVAAVLADPGVLQPPPQIPPVTDAEGTAVAYAVAVLRSLLTTIEENLPGTLDDIDSEFLHDLRVSVRRTRSGLKAFPGVFHRGRLAAFAPGFRWVQQVTGPARDLDVWLLEFERDTVADDPTIVDDLGPLRDLVVAHRRLAHRQLERALRSVRFQRLLDRWRRFLDGPPLGPEADRPTADVASERVWRAYRRVVKPGRAITDDSPPEELHDLRKRGKELRYLLEFFAPLYPRREIAPLVAELKLLQDNLGSFQDDQVQAAHLRTFVDELAAGGAPPATLLALGHLVAGHEAASGSARGEFHDRFAAFDRPDNRRRFETLFAGGRR